MECVEKPEDSSAVSADIVVDTHRSGRPRKLTADQQRQLYDMLQEAPTEAGVDAPASTLALLQEYLRETFEVEYSRPSCRRLMKEAGLSYQKPRRRATEADPKEREEFADELKKHGEMDATVVCIDQTKASVQVEPRAAWFRRGMRPTVEPSGQREWTCVLGAITEDGERFFSRCTEYITAEHAKHFILALCEEFRDDLIVVLDGAPYFRASAVTDLAARDDLVLVRLPPYSPELNPVEECWRQLKDALGTRLFDSLAELNGAIDETLDEISIPTVSNYI